jgi:hypothetical protein
MAVSSGEITKQALDLPRHQQLALVRVLLDLDRPGAIEDVEAPWDEEIQARVTAIDEKRVAGVSDEQTKKDLAGR